MTCATGHKATPSNDQAKSPRVSTDAMKLSASKENQVLTHELRCPVLPESCRVLSASVVFNSPPPPPCPASEAQPSWMALLPSGVSALMVVLGWYVVNKAQANRERRKQIREHIGDLQDELAELEESAIEYHTIGRDLAKEHRVLYRLGRFEKACSDLPRFVKSQRLLKAVPVSCLEIDATKISALNRSVTLAHFADEHDGPVLMGDLLVRELEGAVVEVHNVLENVRVHALD